VLETVDIKDTNKHLCTLRCIAILARQTLVHDRHEPFEHAGINKLSNTVPDHSRLSCVEGGDDLLIAGYDLLLDYPFLEIGEVNTQEAGGKEECRVVIVDRRVCPCLCDLDVSKMKESCEQAEDGPLLLDTDTDGGQRLLGTPELFRVINTVDGCRLGTALLQVEKLGHIRIEAEILLLLRGCASAKLVKDVVVSFGEGLEDDTRSLEKVRADAGANNFLLPIKQDLAQV